MPATHRAAGPPDTGRPCPYCRFPLKEGVPIVECDVCGSLHHLDCWSDNGGCAVVACAGGPSAGGARPETLDASDAPDPATAPIFTAPTGDGAGLAPSSKHRSRALAVIALALVIAGAAVAVALSRNTPAPTTAATRASTVTSVTTVIRSAPTTTQIQPTTATTTQTHPATTEPAPSTGPFPTYGITGRDARGFNYGPGCSDDPSSAQPGCADSPDVPRGDPRGGCPSGATVDRLTTSCALAENVEANYNGDGLVTAFSPERARSFQFNCETAGPGTTGYTICIGKAGSSELYLRWHS